MDVDQVADQIVEVADDQVDLNKQQQQRNKVPTPVTALSNGLAELNFDSDRLKIFYDKIFPAQLFFKWLSYNKMKARDANMLQSIDDKEIESNFFYHREFSFTLANDIYCRYLSFKTAEEFKNALVSRVPHKIDLGAVYNISPQRHLQADKKAFVPQEKEMVFDIDMDSYDDIRQCCTGAKVCQRCWAFPCLAAQLITMILKDDFDIHNVLWVFSGRRGVHGWVCDADARTMNNEMRQAVVQYMSLPLGNENADRLTLSSPLHPHLARAFKVLHPHFENIVIKDQNVLSVPKHQNRFLQYLPYEIVDNVRNKWSQITRKAADQGRTDYGMELWKVWTDIYTNWLHQQKDVKKYTFMEALIFTYLYPRIDAHVSTNINHLLKSPFCVHPKTGNICVPFDPYNYENFILTEVPTLTIVINELGQASKNQADDMEDETMIAQDKQAVVIPSFEPYLKIFRKHIQKCIISEKQIQQEKELDEIAQAVQF